MPRHVLPRNRPAHMAAFFCVLALHGGLAWWQTRPQPAVAMPQQQVVRVAMIAPQPQPQPVQDTPTPQAAAEKGMVKARPEKSKEPAPRRAPEQPPHHTPATSGEPAPEATARHAAVSEPVPADYLQNPPPVYPRAALRRNLQGTVLVEVRVGTDGMPKTVGLRKTCGHRLLDDAALKAVRRWRFVPARRGDEIIEARVVVPVEFRIN